MLLCLAFSIAKSLCFRLISSFSVHIHNPHTENYVSRFNEHADVLAIGNTALGSIWIVTTPTKCTILITHL
ncbi:hypothetical protein BT63DRAFT_425255 [Microthyrium microscopicum]|uniref:Uncharacterized protein n=1 Tax=Microthyrium microscopicum TaxID=703497 RepID=A0A6A6UBC7_9PEZI|nr:hypothetical protein BT63DRAFT_425255 [Microthyrium microscopicum]